MEGERDEVEDTLESRRCGGSVEGVEWGLKQKRWPDWGLNPGPSRHIPDALTTELSGLYQQIN